MRESLLVVLFKAIRGTNDNGCSASLWARYQMVFRRCTYLDYAGSFPNWSPSVKSTVQMSTHNEYIGPTVYSSCDPQLIWDVINDLLTCFLCHSRILWFTNIREGPSFHWVSFKRHSVIRRTDWSSWITQIRVSTINRGSSNIVQSVWVLYRWKQASGSWSTALDLLDGVAYYYSAWHQTWRDWVVYFIKWLPLV